MTPEHGSAPPSTSGADELATNILRMGGLGFTDVTKRHRSGEECVCAADRVSLNVAAGEVVALYGPSGAGKTTILLLAAGMIQPDSGTVRFAGRDVSNLSPKASARYRRLQVGLIFPTFELLAGVSALDNAALKLPAAGHSLRAARAQAELWLDRVGLDARKHFRAEQLSMGERQRVAIARAMTGDPQLLLADEPTGNLDSRRTAEVFELLRDISHESGRACLVVTHDLSAQRYADRVLTLRDGRLSDGLAADLSASAVAG